MKAPGLKHRAHHLINSTKLLHFVVKTAFLMTMAFFSGGCLIDIHRVVSSPGATGVVRDARTRQPIVGAQVAVSRYYPSNAAEDFENSVTVSNALHFIRKPRVISDEAGYFSVPAKQKFIAIILFGDYFPHASGTLVVERPGYKIKVIPISELVPNEVAWYGRTVLLMPSESF